MSFKNTKTPAKPTAKAKWQVPMRQHPTKGVMEYYLEGELKERFCLLFPKNSNRRMMQWFGLSHSTLQRFKRKFGLKKDMRVIHMQLAKDVKKICERNGYYESLRGHSPSEACLEGARQLRASGFHPMKQLKANNLRRYNRLMRKRSEQRKEQYHLERLRMAYGLDRRTKLHIPLCNLSHAASSHKFQMIHKCNYFADPLGDPHVICYDSMTLRSDKREATAVRHGLKIVQADE